MNPVEIVEEQFKVAGLQAQYKRRCKDGTLEDATEKELQVLKVQSQIATSAQQLKQISPAERTIWAIEIKDYANALYTQGFITEAMDKYTEALAASDFSKETGNVNTLVIPILCNLAACCIQTEKYGKGVRFADQALELDPDCCKAHMRKGEFTRASVCLKKALIKVNAECKLIHEIAVQEKNVTSGADDNSDDNNDHCDIHNDDENHDENSSSTFDNSSNYDNGNDENNDVGDEDDNIYDEDEDDSKYDGDRIDDDNDNTVQAEDVNYHEYCATNDNDSHNHDRDDSIKQPSSRISTTNSSNTVINASKTKNIDADIQHDEPTQLEKNQIMKEKILSYIGKTEKKIEVEKINELKRKKAMQKVFSSSQSSSKLILRTKEIRGNKKIENAKHHQLKKKTVFTIIVDFIYLLYRFFLSFITKKKD